MALKKRRRAEPIVEAPAEPAGKSAGLDARKSAQDIQTQLNTRLATNVSKSNESVRLEKLALAKIVPDPDNQRTWYINLGTITINEGNSINTQAALTTFNAGNIDDFDF